MNARRVTAVALNTYRETVRDRIFYLVAVFGFVMLASTAVLSPLTVGAQGKIMTDVAHRLTGAEIKAVSSYIQGLHAVAE